MKEIGAILTLMGLCVCAEAQVTSVGGLTGNVGLSGPLTTSSNNLALQTTGSGVAVLATAPTLNGPLTLNTAASSLTQGLNVTLPSPSGTNSNPVLNAINIGTTSSDNVNAGGGFVNGFQIAHLFGGSSAHGGRETLAVYGYLTAATNSSNSNRNYVGVSISEAALSGDNGTSGSPKGALFSIGVQTILCGSSVILACTGTPATNWFDLEGAEFDVAAFAGSSTYVKSGLHIALQSNDAVHGSSSDSALLLSNEAGAAGWNNGILLNAASGAQPLASAGCILCTSGSSSITTGLDISSYNFSGNAIKTPGFTVTGTGALFVTFSDPSLPVVWFQNTHAAVGDYGLDLEVGAHGTDTTSGMILFYDATGTSFQGSISRNGSAAVAYNSTSDQRLKIDHGPGTQGLADLMRIRVHDFAFRSEPDRVQEGFFAQELADIYPQCVTVGTDDPVMHPWQVDKGCLTPLLVASIQELQRELRTLKESK